MTRVGPVAVAVGVALLITAADDGGLAAAAIGGPVLLAGLTSLWASRRSSAELPWAPPPRPTAPAQRARPTPGAGAVTTALGRFEARQLVRSPWWSIGVGFSALMALDFALLSPDPLDWSEVVVSLPFLAHPLVGMAVLASHRGASRAARDGVAELLAATPTSEARRRAGVLRSATVVVAGLAAFFAVYLAGAALSEAGTAGSAGPVVPIVLSGLLLGAGGVALGVLLARAWTHPLAPVLALVAIGLVSPRLADSAGGAYSPRLLLSTLPPVGDTVTVLTAGQEWLHAGWLAALAAVTSVAAWAAPRRPSLPRLRGVVEARRTEGVGT